MALTPKQERFAQLRAAAFALPDPPSQSESYRQVYNVSPDTSPATVYEDASRLAALPEVAARINELKAAAAATVAAKRAWDLDRLVAEAEINLDMARKGGHRSIAAANGALDLIGRAQGLLDRRLKVDVSGQVDHRHVMASWTDEELRALIAARDVLLGREPDALEPGTVEGSLYKEGDGDDGERGGDAPVGGGERGDNRAGGDIPRPTDQASGGDLAAPLAT